VELYLTQYRIRNLRDMVPPPLPKAGGVPSSVGAHNLHLGQDDIKNISKYSGLTGFALRQASKLPHRSFAKSSLRGREFSTTLINSDACHDNRGVSMVGVLFLHGGLVQSDGGATVGVFGRVRISARDQVRSEARS
jgi:hypothetical protein